MSKDLGCSFCEKTQNQVTELLQNGNTEICICNECVGTAVGMLAQIQRRKRENAKPELKVQKG